MKKYFLFSIGLLVFNSLFASVVSMGNLSLNSEHFELLFVFLSYLIFFIGLFRFEIIQRSNFSRIDLVLIASIIIWFLVIIVRSVGIPVGNISTLPRFLGGRLYGPAFIVPFFVFLGGNISILTASWRFTNKLVLLFFFLIPLVFIFNTKSIIYIIGFLPILFLNQEKLSRNEKVLVNIAMIAFMLFSIRNGNRTEFAALAYYVILASLIANKNKFKSTLGIRIRGIVLIFILMAGFAYMYSGNLSKHFTDQNIVENIKSYEKDNLNMDSRTMVFEDFASDFSDWKDWVFGRGVLGTTFSPQYIKLQEIYNTAGNIFKFPVGYRAEIENGYLQIILKSGIIGLLLYIVIALRAIFLGIFRSNNSFTIVCTFIILERFLSMTGFALPNYSLDYIMYWLCIGFCLSEKVRSLSSIEIYFMLRGGKYYQPKFIKGENAPDIASK